MIQKKVCMLGGFSVGKTSLVSRFVTSMFSEKYLTTVGVKIDKKAVVIAPDRQVELILWDLCGEDEFQKVRMSYLRGASGYLLVADGTRRATLDTALGLKEAADKAIGPVPFLLILNKWDLADAWEIDPDVVNALVRWGWTVIATSAKTGSSVEQAFHTLARQMSPV